MLNINYPNIYHLIDATYNILFLANNTSRNFEMTIDPDDVFDQVEEDRRSGKLSKTISNAKFRYQGSGHEDLIEQINTETGERKIGRYENGKFIPIEAE